jgi:hypothetical protein
MAGSRHGNEEYRRSLEGLQEARAAPIRVEGNKLSQELSL